MRSITTKGFTLIELLVVLAVIAILASIIIVSLTGQRDRANTAGAATTASSVVPVATTCAVESTDLNTPSTSSAICTGSPTWPELPTGWHYYTGGLTQYLDIDVSGLDFTFTVANHTGPAYPSGTVYITCTIDGCAEPATL